GERADEPTDTRFDVRYRVGSELRLPRLGVALVVLNDVVLTEQRRLFLLSCQFLLEILLSEGLSPGRGALGRRVGELVGSSRVSVEERELEQHRTGPRPADRHGKRGRAGLDADDLAVFLDNLHRC